MTGQPEEALHAHIELGDAYVSIRARGKFRDNDARDFVPTPESALLLIDTPNYDGPLDLLLHLIRKHSMDIFDIPIILITQKYLEALNEIQTLNLDIAGEFLAMAASLTEIKSKMLLPKEEATPNLDDDSEGLDPRQELIKRLLIYKTFQEAGQQLLKRDCLGRDMFFRIPNEQEISHIEEEKNLSPRDLAPIELFDLVEKLAAAIKKSEHQSVHTITRDRISVSARIRELFEYCQIRTQFSFIDALKFFPIYEKIDVIVTFLAILEMARLKLLSIQMATNKELIIAVKKDNFYTKQDEILRNIEDSDNRGYEE
jgi:segregation and condensation protein A